MNKSFRLVLVTTLLMVLPLSILSAQEGESLINIVYARLNNGKSFQLVSHSAENEIVLEIFREDCFSISPSMSYLAIKRFYSPNVDVYSLLEGETINSLNNKILKISCDFQWRNDETLIFSQENETTGIGEFELEVNIFTGGASLVKEVEENVSLNNAVPYLIADDFRLLSPDGKLIVYNQCEGNRFVYDSFANNQSCSSQEDIIIYDIENQQILQRLENAQQERFALNGYETLAFSFGGIAWSPSGRYLAYLTTPAKENIPFLVLYDTHDQKYIKFTIPALMEMNKVRGFRWRPDEKILAFWMMDYQSSGERIAIVDIDAMSIDFADQIYDLPSANWILTPTSVVFIDNEYNLIDFNIQTKSYLTIDNNVWDIFGK